jgi:hypothetical protein
VAITWISWGVAPGYINAAPLGLDGSYLSYFGFSKSPIFSLFEYTYQSDNMAPFLLTLDDQVFEG